MTIRTRARVAGMMTAVFAAGAPLAAQAAGTICQDGTVTQASIGVLSIQCAGRTCQVPGSERIPLTGGRSNAPADSYRFTAEPTILSMDPESPGAGVLKPWDALVSVNGNPITTGAAARILSGMEVGDSLLLVVRRDGQFLVARVEVGSTCSTIGIAMTEATAVVDGQVWSLSGGPGVGRAIEGMTLCRSRDGAGPAYIVPRDVGCGDAAGSEPIRAGARLGRPGVAVVPSPLDAAESIVRSESLGAVFRGAQEVHVGPDGVMAWQFRSVPIIAEVTPGGPAERAGLAPGDRIISVGGALVTSPEAAETLQRLESGDAVSLVVESGTEARTVIIRPQAGGGW